MRGPVAPCLADLGEDGGDALGPRGLEEGRATPGPFLPTGRNTPRLLPLCWAEPSVALGTGGAALVPRGPPWLSL